MLHKRIFPPLGQRILKTALAVYICLLVHMLLEFRGNVGSSIVAAIICMQPYMEDTRTFALDRVAGTILGSAWALLFLLIMRYLPAAHFGMVEVYFIMMLFVIMAIYSTVVIKKSTLAALVAITMMSAINNYPDVQTPLMQTLTNLGDTIIGTIIAVIVNIARLPRTKHPEYLFFVRTMDLVPDRYAQVPSSVHITLDHLYKDGAKICLISRWAPAFIIAQMGLLNVNAPIIIMDGAGLYDILENRYLDVVDIPKENVRRLCSILSGFGAGCNIYTVNERTMTIYHEGPINEAERRESETMRRSLYRNYKDGTFHEEDYLAFVRVIDEADKIDELAYELKSVLPSGMFRMELRQEGRFPEYKGIYFYDSGATTALMKQRVLEIMQQQSAEKLIPVDMLPRMTKYLPEHDALILLGRLKRKFEPVTLFQKSKRKQAQDAQELDLEGER